MANAPATFRDRLYLALHIIPGGSLLFALVPLVVFGYLGWYHYAAPRIDRTFYSLKMDKIQISTQPDWIKVSVLDEVYKNNRLDRINLLDPSANAEIASAFETHSSWVKKATSVRKFSDTVYVDLIYRQPIALIWVPYQDKENRLVKGVYALDADGVVLPVSEDFAQRHSDFLIIDIANIGTQVAGSAYADVRVHQALKLITFLQMSNHKELGLQWLYVDRDNDVSSGRPWKILLKTTDDRLIDWGHIPGEENGGEESADRKLNRLSSWLKSEREKNSKGGALDLSNSRVATGQTTSAP